jgi:hypothetical protein
VLDVSLPGIVLHFLGVYLAITNSGAPVQPRLAQIVSSDSGSAEPVERNMKVATQAQGARRATSAEQIQ